MLTLDYEGCSVTGDLNPFQEALQALIATDRSVAAVARKAGVSARVLWDWAKGGRMPRARHYESVARMERAFDLEAGALLSLIPDYRKKAKREKSKGPVIQYRENLREWTKDRYKLKPAAVPEAHPLRAEWQAFVRYKVNGESSIVGALQIRGVLSRALRSKGAKSWSTRPLQDHWKCEAIRARKWIEILDDSWVPTANRMFNTLSAFLGWLILGRERGGAGLSLDRLSLGLLADQTLVLSYLEWRAERAKQINGDHVYFVDSVLSLLHPEDGFLLKSVDIGKRVGFDPAGWRSQCDKTYEWLRKEVRPHLVDAREQAGRSRDPKDPIEHILELERPLDAIVRMLNRMEADRPTTGGEHEAAWARDMALIALMASNPLRIMNFIHMTYRPDNTGELRQTATGEWRIYIDKNKIKNTRGMSSEEATI